jgi:hypothetical protein
MNYKFVELVKNTKNAAITTAIIGVVPNLQLYRTQHLMGVKVHLILFVMP